MSSTNRTPSRPAFRVSPARRALDVLVSATLLVLCTPLLLLTALAMLVSDGRPLLFRQVRVGEHGRPFTILKLRSMSVSKGGPEVTAATDARITRLGAFLRRTSIDELPQLWHVLRGDMTLVGPRPETVALAERYPESSRRVLLARPGLTGPAQLRYRERSAVPPEGGDVEGWYLDVLVPLRAQADLEYLDRPTLRHTVRYIWLTALFVVGLVDLQQAVSAALPDQLPDRLAPDTLA
jgi:lipopolysaccharide/colanic/teichoic acid biosynthesis glycosyltransferase